MRARSSSLRSLAGLALSVVTLTAASGCTTEAVCFTACTGVSGDSGGKGGTGSGELGGSLSIGMGGEFELGTSGSPDVGGGKLEDAGAACDGVDLTTDLDNCGSCGNVCIFTGADALCVDGKCQMGECHDSRYDLDMDANNGCEYACSPAADATEVCNYIDDDCDGVVDNGFDLTTDAENCGVCGRSCALLHAGSECEPDSGTPSCVVTTCEDGWYDVDGVDANGCEYQCQKTGPGGVACAPGDANCGQELCDALDNDCNGVINDGNQATGGPQGGQPCLDYCGNMACKGECSAGVSTCVGNDLVCIPGKGPSLETCDGKDNDCDGVADNGFDLSTDANNCGSCGSSCVDALPNAIGKCMDPDGPNGATAPGCTVLTCKSGYNDLNPSSPGCEQCPKFPTTAETCNGIDDDCDGIVDNIVDVAAQRPAPDVFCNNGRALAGTLCSGTAVKCGGARGWVCDYSGASAGIEVDPVSNKVRVIEASCDGVDGNCDGQNDEAFLNKGDDCTVGAGACARSSKYACKADKSGTECPATAVAKDAKDELCNGLDDDCDGQIDERVPVAGSLCYTGNVSHPCVGYVDPMVKVSNNLWVYTYEASRPDATTTDPGVYDVRSCSKAGVLPWSNISQVDADNTCKAIPTSAANTKLRLCTETEWQTACLAGQPSTSPVWSFSTTSAPYDDDVCNDANALVDGPWVTAFNNGQSQRCRTSTQLWDMSGNVAEWTSSCVTVLGKQYCRVRGGSYLSQGPATTCSFNFVLDVPGFLNFDLGFRCCSSAAP